jgi:predicted transcriptional regulator
LSTIDQTKISELKANRPAFKVLLTLCHPMFLGHYVHGRDLEQICNLGRSTIWRALKSLWEEEMIEYDPQEKSYSARATARGARHARYLYESLGALSKYEKWAEDVSQAQQDGILPTPKVQVLKNELRDYLSFL